VKKLSILVLASSLFGWNMVGWSAPTTPPSDNENIIWCYQDGNFTTNFSNGKYPKLSKIEGGEACWSEKNITNSTQNDTYQWVEGWNFVTPVFKNWNLNNRFLDNNITGRKYVNNKLIPAIYPA
jgi:hypothetical protein